MTKVSTTVRVPVPAAEVWDRIGAFDAVEDWHPAVEKVTLEQGGTVRRAYLADGGESVERLVEDGEAKRSYSYELVEGPMPVSEYQSTLAVEDNPTGGALIRWSSEFTTAGASEDEAMSMIHGFLRIGLDNLVEAFGRRS